MLKVSSNPHIRSKDTTARIMQYVVIALLPATLFGIFHFGLHALLLVLVTVATTVLTEYIYDRCMKKKVSIGDFSAVVTGLLLALNLPPKAPWWIGVIGGVFAIIVVKMLFGGLGQNFMNPALGARCFLIISFTSIMTNFDCDAYTGATPLAAIKAGEGTPELLDMIIGRTAGTIGETSMIALLIGAVFLLVMKVIDLRVPGSYILSFVVFILLFSGRGLDINYILSQLAGGGLMLGAFFYGDRLCDQTDHEKRTVCVWHFSGHYDRYSQDFRAVCGGRLLRDHPWKSAGAVDRAVYEAYGFWEKEGKEGGGMIWITKRNQ